MARSDKYDNDTAPASPSHGRTHPWIGPVLGAVLGFVLGTAIVSLAAAYLPEGSSWFAGPGLTIQTVGALLGAFIGALLSRRK